MGVVSSTIAGTLGLIALAAGGGVAAVAQSRSLSKASKKQERVRQQMIESQQKATAEAQAAPEKAAEKARLDSLSRRKRRARTILTSASGVLEPAGLEKPRLFGA